MFKNKSCIWWIVIGWWLITIYYLGIWWWLTPIKLVIKKIKEKKEISKTKIQANYKEKVDKSGIDRLDESATSNNKKTNKNISHEFEAVDYTVIDIETTGLSNTFDKIIELSALKIRDNEINSQYTTLVNPGIKIPSNIKLLTGIDDNMVKNSPKIDDVIEEFINFISDDVLLGHNVTFDIKFINNNIKDNNLKLENNYIDTLTISRKKLPYLDNHKLITLLQHYSISKSQSHRALSDCIATHQLYQKLINENDREYVVLPEVIKPFFGINKAHIVKENEDNLFYNIPEKYQSDITKLVLTVNDYVVEASNLVTDINPFMMTEKDIIFIPQEYELVYNKEFDLKTMEIHNATIIQEEVFTSLGNIKKHPFIIHFYSDKEYRYNENGFSIADEVFGKIFINKDGNPSRYEIVHWNKDKLHTIICILSGNDIVIDRIQFTDNNGNRFNMYKR